jgi:hypothetical protein
MLKYFLFTGAITSLQAWWMIDKERKKNQERTTVLIDSVLAVLYAVICPLLMLASAQVSETASQLDQEYIHKCMVYYLRIQVIDCALLLLKQFLFPHFESFKLMKYLTINSAMAMIAFSCIRKYENPIMIVYGLEEFLRTNSFTVISIYATDLLLVWKIPRVELDARPRNTFADFLIIVFTLGLILVIDAFEVLFQASFYYAPYFLTTILLTIHFLLPTIIPSVLIHLLLVYIVMIDIVDRCLVVFGGATAQRIIRPLRLQQSPHDPTNNNANKTTIKKLTHTNANRNEGRDVRGGAEEEEELNREWMDRMVLVLEWMKFLPPFIASSALLFFASYQLGYWIYTILYDIFFKL